jgi:hypothetical protein
MGPSRLLAVAVVVALGGFLREGRAQEGEPPRGYERVSGKRFRVERMPFDEKRASAALDLLEIARSGVEERLGQSLGEPAPLVILAPTEEEFVRRFETLEGAKPAGDEAAVAWPARRTILVRGPRVDSIELGLLSVLRHELAHIALGRIEEKSERPLPRWLNEGLAEFAAGVQLSRSDELELAGKASAGTLDDLEQLETRFPHHAAGERAYRESLSFVQWLDAHARGGVRGVVEALARLGTEEAIFRTTGHTVHEDEIAWKVELAQKSSVWESLARSSGFWWGLLALLAVVAGLRQVIVQRRLKQAMPD